MTIPYHEHRMQIAIATKEDINAGVATDKFVTPAILGTAATANKEDFIGKEHLTTIDKAVPNKRKIITGQGLTGGGELTKDITLSIAEDTLKKITELEKKLEALSSNHNADSGVLAGFIILQAKKYSNPPPGWLHCDGQALSRTEYSRLFNVIGEKWGKGDGKTTFNVPDFNRNTFVPIDAGGNHQSPIWYFIKT